MVKLADKKIAVRKSRCTLIGPNDQPVKDQPASSWQRQRAADGAPVVVACASERRQPKAAIIMPFHFHTSDTHFSFAAAHNDCSRPHVA